MEEREPSAQHGSEESPELEREPPSPGVGSGFFRIILVDAMNPASFTPSFRGSLSPPPEEKSLPLSNINVYI